MHFARRLPVLYQRPKTGFLRAVFQRRNPSLSRLIPTGSKEISVLAIGIPLRQVPAKRLSHPPKLCRDALTVSIFRVEVPGQEIKVVRQKTRVKTSIHMQMPDQQAKAVAHTVVRSTQVGNLTLQIFNGFHDLLRFVATHSI